MGSIDKIIRLIIAATIATFYITAIIKGAFGFILLLISGILFITAFMSFCPVYKILGYQSCKTKEVK